MVAVQTTIPITRLSSQQILPTTKELAVSAWPGIRSWRSPDSYVNGQWIDRIEANYGDPPLVNNFNNPPTLTTISGRQYLTFNNNSRLRSFNWRGLAGAGDDFSSGEFTLAFIYHPNNTADTDVIFNSPHEVTPDASNKYLSLFAFFNTTNFFLSWGARGSTTTTILQPSSGGGLLSLTAPHVILLCYSAGRGYTLRVNSGVAVNQQLASPTSAQTINRNQFQIGGFGASVGNTNLMFGGLGDLYVFNIDLTLPANSATLTAVEARLTADWL